MVKEKPLMIDTQTACKVLGVGKNYLTQVKKEMGIKGAQRFFLDDVVEHIRLRSRPRPNRRRVNAGSSDVPSSRRDLKAA